MDARQWAPRTGFTPLKILTRILCVKIVELMATELRPSGAIQALPPGLQGKIAKPAELPGVPALPRQNACHGVHVALLILQSLLEVQIAPPALSHGRQTAPNAPPDFLCQGSGFFLQRVPMKPG